MQTLGSTRTSSFLPADLNRLRRESEMMLATVDSLSAAELAQPSGREGWSVAQVVAHLVVGAEELTEQAQAALDGSPRPFPTAEQHQSAVDALAAETATTLKQRLHRGTQEFDEVAQRLRGGVVREEVECRFGPLRAYALVMMRITEVLLGHQDLNTVWELDEADMDALQDALEVAVQVSAEEDWATGVTLRTHEGDEFVLGDGAVPVRGERAAALGWLTRGRTEGLRATGEVPPSCHRLFR